METIAYLINFFKDRNIGAIAPTSRYSIKKILKLIDFLKVKVLVEYGPGRGVITKELLKKLGPSALLIAIERNKDFYNYLINNIKDTRLHVFNDSAENIKEILKNCRLQNADYIVSGIPFSLFPEELQDKIIINTREALSEEGKFIIYQYHTTILTKSKDIGKKISEHMHIQEIKLALSNIPPLKVLTAQNSEIKKTRLRGGDEIS